jgi:hypothetical protein
VARSLLNRGLALGGLGRVMEAIAVHDDLIARFGASADTAIAESVAKARQMRATWSELAKNARPAGTG